MTRWTTIAWPAIGKKTSDCLNPPLAIFSKQFVSRCRGNKLLVNLSIMNVPGAIVVCKRLGIRISFQCKVLLIQIP